MARRYYLTSRSTDATGASCPAGFETLPYVSMDYGREDLFIVIADTTVPQNNTLKSNAGVFVCPDVITTNLSAGDVTVLVGQLGARRMPTGWVTTAITYKDVLTTIVKFCHVMQKLVSGRTTAQIRAVIDSNIENLTAAQKGVLQSTLGPLVDTPLPTSGPVKTALKTIVDGLPQRELSKLLTFLNNVT
jgi:hypothetical protein